MELFQVRYFLALARTLNFTRAAEACNVSQPALTRAIQRLEDELGGPLLHRERNLTQLTALGRAMLPHLEAAHAAAESAAAQAAAFRRRDSEPLRLGIDGTLSARILGPALRALQERIPGFEFGLAEAGSGDLLERMMEGELDSAILVEPVKPPERLDRWRLFGDRYVVLCPEDHPLTELDEIPTAALARESLLTRERVSDFDQALERICTVAGFAPKPRHRCSGEDQIHQMVAAGLGIALSAEHCQGGDNIVARPLVTRGARISSWQRSPAAQSALASPADRARDWRGQESLLVSKP
jgi:DNA-binding transcriptional LysR family regulator